MDEVLDFPVLDEATHTYTVKGVVIPGVTTVIKPLINYDNIPSHVLEWKRGLGVAVHKACELYDMGKLDKNSIDPAVEMYLNAWMRFLRETKFQIETLESVVYHKGYRYAGTNDRTGILNGNRCVIDLKTTAQLSPAVGVQTAAYMAAENERLVISPFQLTHRFGLQLKPDGSYRLQEYKDISDFSTFLGCLQIYNWRARHGC